MKQIFLNTLFLLVSTIFASEDPLMGYANPNEDFKLYSSDMKVYSFSHDYFKDIVSAFVFLNGNTVKHNFSSIEVNFAYKWDQDDQWKFQRVVGFKATVIEINRDECYSKLITTSGARDISSPSSSDKYNMSGKYMVTLKDNTENTCKDKIALPDWEMKVDYYLNSKVLVASFEATGLVRGLAKR